MNLKYLQIAYRKGDIWTTERRIIREVYFTANETSPIGPKEIMDGLLENVDEICMRDIL